MIKSIAIFGATEKHASVLAESLASNNYRLLLLSEVKQALTDLRDQILIKTPSADIELLDCSTEASWQADSIILALSYELQEMIAAWIGDFVTQKTVIAYVDSAQEALNALPSTGLQNLLPNAHIISLYLTNDQEKQKVFYVGGLDEEALNETMTLLMLSGFIPGISQLTVTP
ncbi:Predicted dinucleotide-binding enzyme [Daejeonella rubra]|uniref:Predicted dinucleotide-binding enzyme n=1 Tax=Daejeonella rubra TaxID=990371 RepID=A0A1G9V0B4_9SPHI|nr:hypothetical protein [Daejeonella rubra]SDM65345.1 Predicted dinucleotide-binding enzyme [Daejeonella rubra]